MSLFVPQDKASMMPEKKLTLEKSDTPTLEIDYTNIENRFKDRLSRFKKGCSNLRDQVKKKVRNKYGSLAEGKLQWCRIPKIGSKYMARLIEKTTKSTFSTRYDSNITENFMFVREPYSRLLSGYLDKLGTYPQWWQGLGEYITDNFKGSNKTNETSTCGHDVTFPEFVKYFIHSETYLQRQDKHFMPMFRHCGACQKSFKYIGHLETLYDDVKYIFGSININISSEVISRSDVQTIRAKCSQFLNDFFNTNYSRCLSVCDAMQKVWWSFHIRGLIGRDVEFPLSGKPCTNITGRQLTEMAVTAHEESKGKFDKHKQKSEFTRELFLQVSIEDRLTVRKLLKRDFLLFGYDDQPAGIFPELIMD